MRRSRSLPVVAALAGTAIVPVVAGATGAGASGHRTLVPIGSDYAADTLERVAAAAAAHDTDGSVKILVLPITYSLDAFTSSKSERKKNLTLADTRRGQVESACLAVVAPGVACDVRLVPTLVRDDAFLASNLAYFDGEVDGMYVLGGDQTVAMNLVQNTPLEDRMAAAYTAGAVFGGNSAGDAIQSRTMINGYAGANDVPESMRQGAIDIWAYGGDADPTRGLKFGLPDAITDQHVFERGRMGRSLNASLTTGMPIVGMDAATGARITDETTLADVTGLTSGYVLDPHTLGATATWAGPNSTLAARDVVAHLIAPGGDGYDLSTRLPSFAGAAEAAPAGLATRTLPAVSKAGAGTLLLGGGAAAATVGPRFVSLAGGASARIVVITTGYAKAATAQADAKAIAATLQPGVTASVQWFVLDAKANQSAITTALANATGVWLSSPDRSRIGAALTTGATTLAAVSARWNAGAVVMADDAVAAALGGTYAAAAPQVDPEAESYLQMLDGAVPFAAGRGWYTGIDVQPQLLPGYNWPQLLRLVAAQPSRVGVGIDVGTAIEVGGGAPVVRGASAVVAIDGRTATIRTGSNGSLSAHWLVIDTYADGQALTT